VQVIDAIYKKKSIINNFEGTLPLKGKITLLNKKESSSDISSKNIASRNKSVSIADIKKNLQSSDNIVFHHHSTHSILPEH
jgi:beta-glucanase (GH16 family)